MTFNKTRCNLKTNLMCCIFEVSLRCESILRPTWGEGRNMTFLRLPEADGHAGTSWGDSWRCTVWLGQRNLVQVKKTHPGWQCSERLTQAGVMRNIPRMQQEQHYQQRWLNNMKQVNLLHEWTLKSNQMQASWNLNIVFTTSCEILTTNSGHWSNTKKNLVIKKSRAVHIIYRTGKLTKKFRKPWEMVYRSYNPN